MLQRQFEGIDGTTYATEANAVKALVRAVNGACASERLRYVIATDQGRYFAVFLPDADQVQLAIHLAHRGIACIR
jgi:methyl coenzyme M reductase gamma subunit